MPNDTSPLLSFSTPCPMALQTTAGPSLPPAETARVASWCVSDAAFRSRMSLTTGWITLRSGPTLSAIMS